MSEVADYWGETVMPKGKDPRKKEDSHFLEPDIDQPLARDLLNNPNKKELPGRDKWKELDGSHKLDPGGGVSPRDFEIEKALQEAREFRKNKKVQKTFYDPDNFPEHLKNAANAAGEQDIQKISASEIDALKDTSLKGDSTEVRVRQTAGSILRSLTTTVSSLFSKPVSKKTQCEIYGHRPPPPGWTGAYPKCSDCGAEILTQKDMRSSSANQREQKDIKAYDNKLNL